MAKWQAAYWGEEETVEVYEFSKSGARRLFSGRIDSLEPAAGRLKKRVLVVGRNNLVRLRKRYPPAKMDKLRQAVVLEAPDLFPIPNPALHCRIDETYASHVLLDIWAWDKDPVDRLRAVFPFRYAIPEDLAFLSLPPMIHVYQTGAMIQVLACGGGRFIDAASCPASSFAPEDMEKFRIGLAGNAPAIHGIRIYGDHLPAPVDPTSLKVTRLPATIPSSFVAISNSDFAFRPFRLAEGGLPLPDRSMFFRFAIYAALACGFGLFLTVENYNRALNDAHVFSKAIDKEIALVETGREGDGDKMEALKEFQEKIKGNLSPSRVFDALALDLPEGSYLKSLSINDGVVEASILSRDPLSAIKRLEGGKHFYKLRLKGTPASDSTTGAYAFSLLLEMKP